MEFQMRRFPMPPEFDFQNSMFNDFLEEERKKKHEAEAIHGQMVKVAVEEVSDK